MIGYRLGVLCLSVGILPAQFWNLVMLATMPVASPSRSALAAKRFANWYQVTGRLFCGNLSVNSHWSFTPAEDSPEIADWPTTRPSPRNPLACSQFVLQALEHLVLGDRTTNNRFVQIRVEFLWCNRSSQVSGKKT
jgi:hypothetical protein